MSKAGIYENLPLQPLDKAETQSLLKANSVKTSKKRKSASEIPRLHNSVSKGRPSKSVSETFSSTKREESTSSSSETLKAANEDVFSSYEASPKTSKSDGKAAHKLVTHSTPTSTLDDGYESCNSTPHGSGEF